MENLVAALKLLGPIMLTPLINRVISSFRFRQLYLSFEDVLPCTLPENNGYTANIRLYNKGKDKENKIEIIFPRTSTCQILSSNYPTVSNEGARILIDRILPKQTIILSAGPAALCASIVIALTLSFMYIAVSDTNILSPYYNYKYKPLLDQGFRPLIFSRVHLAQNVGHSSKSPLTTGKPYIEHSQIVLPITIKNIHTQRISVSIQPNYPEARTKEIEKATRNNPELSKRVKAWRVIDEKYGSNTDDKLFIDSFLLAPGEERTELVKKTVTLSTNLDNFNLTISIEDPENSEQTEFYYFDLHQSKEKDSIVNLMKKLGTQ